MNSIQVLLPCVKGLNLGTLFVTKNLSSKKEHYRISEAGILSKAVYEKIPKTKEEVLEDYTREIIQYEKASDQKKLFLGKPFRRLYKNKLKSYQRVNYTGYLTLQTSEGNNNYEIDLEFENGKENGFFKSEFNCRVSQNKAIEELLGMKKTKKKRVLPKPLSEFITVLKNKKPIVNILFFTKKAKKEIENSLKKDKIDYRWESK